MQRSFNTNAVAVAAIALLGSAATACPAEVSRTYETTPMRSGRLPLASPPTTISQFAQSLDLPQPGNYSDEVIRFTQGGFAPVRIVQFAVVRKGNPVQALSLNAKGHWTVTSQNVSTLPWVQYLALRREILTLAASISRGTAASSSDGAASPLANVCTDDGPGTLEYSGGWSSGLSFRIDGCSHPEAVAFGLRLYRIAHLGGSDSGSSLRR